MGRRGRNKVPVSNITPLKEARKMTASIAMKAGRINEMLIAFLNAM